MKISNITKSVLGCTLFLFLTMQGIHGSDGLAYPPIGPLPPLTIPANNPQTPAKVELGKKLFLIHDSQEIICLAVLHATTRH